MVQKTVQSRQIGQTYGTGYEIGARRTFSLSTQAAWELLTSEEGLQLWLGDVPQLQLEPGLPYQARDGAEGTIGVVYPLDHLRLTWRPPDWQRASTIQVRLIPHGAKTVIAFHQEQLPGGREREEMYRRWQAALDGLEMLAGEKNDS